MKGNSEFDPFGFAETFDPKWLREAELKHGRVAMLATVGWLVQVIYYYYYYFGIIILIIITTGCWNSSTIS